MSTINRQNWKSEYIPWYRQLESVFGNYVPKLTDEKIIEYVSRENWIIIPVQGESDKKDSRFARRPNLWFSLLETGFIDFGIVYDKLQSVERLRNIIAPFNEYERNQIIGKLAILDDSFVTKVHRKTKTHHFSEAPNYKVVFKQKSNLMDHDQFVKAFDAVDNILNERDILDTDEKYELAPSIDLVSGTIQRDKRKFAKALAKIKPIYEFAINFKTESEAKKKKPPRRSSLASWYCSNPKCKKEVDKLFICESCGAQICQECYDENTKSCKLCRKE